MAVDAQAKSHREVVVRDVADGKFRHSATIGPHRITVDEPDDVGGTDSGPTPYDLVLAALGACSSMTVRMYAERKGWPLEHVEVRLRHKRVHTVDCATCDSDRPGYLDVIEREISFRGDLTEEQRTRLVQIAEKCPVHRTLSPGVSIHTRMV